MMQQSLSAPPKTVFTLQWHITHKCNLRCQHCYQEDYAAFSSEDDLLRTLAQYERFLTETGFSGRLNITGGEPLTHPGLFKLLRASAQRGIPTAILTNGTLITEKSALLLRQVGVDYVQVSLDGSLHKHEKIRGEGSFLSALEGISRLLDAGLDTTVAFTAQRGNAGELRKLAALCQSMNVGKLWFDRVVVPAADDAEQLALSPKQTQRLYRRAGRLQKTYPVVSCARALQFLYSDQRQVYRCSAGKTLLAVLANGDVMPCRRLPVILGNIREQTLSEIWNLSPELKALREAAFPEGCAACSHRETCAGGAKCVAFAKTGHWDVPDPDCPCRQETHGCI